MKKLLLADDHQIVLDGLSTLLEAEDDIEVVGKARSGEEVLRFLKSNSVDILLADIEMPEMDGIELTKKVRQLHPEVKVLILSMYNRPEMIRQLAEIKVDGFVMKDAGRMELLLAIEHLSNNDTYYSQHFTQALIESQKVPRPNVDLTERELEVLKQLAEGKNTTEVADTLFISTHTVQSHRKNLLAKFGVHNTTSLLKEATKARFISID